MSNIKEQNKYEEIEKRMMQIHEVDALYSFLKLLIKKYKKTQKYKKEYTTLINQSIERILLLDQEGKYTLSLLKLHKNIELKALNLYLMIQSSIKFSYEEECISQLFYSRNVGKLSKKYIQVFQRIEDSSVIRYYMQYILEQYMIGTEDLHAFFDDFPALIMRLTAEDFFNIVFLYGSEYNFDFLIQSRIENEIKKFEGLCLDNTKDALTEIRKSKTFFQDCETFFALPPSLSEKIKTYIK